MYIEVFLIDNFIMDALIVRMASALCAAPVKAARLALFSLIGTALAFASLLFPPLTSLPGKLASVLVMAFALRPAGVAQYARAAASMTAAALVTGGLAYMTALAEGGGMDGGALTGGILLQTALLTAAAASFGPALIRHMRKRRTPRLVKMYVAVGSERYTLRGLVDTGSALTEPLSGLPVIAAYLPRIAQNAKIPVPAVTLAGSRTLYALKPDALIIDGRASDALIAPVTEKISGADALIPYMIFGEAV